MLAATGAAVILRSNIAIWVVADERESGGSVAYDLSSFVFFLPLVALVYLFIRHGSDGIIPVGWYVLLALGGAIFAWLPSLIVFMITGQFPAI